MGIFRFIFSKSFLVQLILAAIVSIILAFLAFQWLDYYTRHGELIKVPSLSKMKLEKADNILDKKDLTWEVIDSSKYNPDYPPFSVVKQAPEAGDFVKKNRTIYLTLNPSDYPTIEIPDLIRKTRRQAEASLRALGFKIGKITYKPDIAKNSVLKMLHDGKVVHPGDRLKKTAVIDLVLGDGTLTYGVPIEDNSSPDKTNAPEKTSPNNSQKKKEAAELEF